MEGYWLAHYDNRSRHGEGMVMLRGGDLEHVWSGTYEEEPPKLYVRIRVVPFVSCAEERSMAREQPAIMNLSGFCTSEFATLEGYPEGREGERFHIEMRRCKSMRGEAAPAQKAASKLHIQPALFLAGSLLGGPFQALTGIADRSMVPRDRSH